MKHTSGTFSTYLGELRRADLITEDSVGFTLTDAGFDYLGGRPAPMTGEELQQHYLSILRAGAARILQAVIDAYPNGLTKSEISEQVGIVATSGTFSTYVGELRRNGLIDQHGAELVATDILMQGAAA
ncbi:MAG: winged helix-turn-helix domain-containing protein [Mycobacterium sp.]